MNLNLTEVLQHGAVWRGADLAQTEAGLPTGFAALDQALPGHGWPRGALTEILNDHAGIGELALIMPAIARQTQQGLAVVLINPPYWLYAPAWAGQGVSLAQCLVVRPQSAGDVLWTAEQCLRAGACGLVVIWPEFAGQMPDHKHLRRLQAAANAGQTVAILFRSEQVAMDASPAPLRLQLATAAHQLAVRVLKRRGLPLSQAVLLAVRDEQARYEDIEALNMGNQLPTPFPSSPLRSVL